MKSVYIALSVSVGLAFSATCQAALKDDIASLQQSWAKVNYELKDDAQEKAFQALVKDSQSVVEHYPDSAESHIWHGIIKSSYAGAKGGLGALGLAKEAKVEFERAIEIDKEALNGSALTSLGTLYSQVPGWPIGFGSDKKARTLFEQSLAINPYGLDINYFYAQFLYDEREYGKALIHLKQAQAAPKRPGREKADQYRQAEVTELLARIEKKLKRKK
ncbi:tetratricopeptide repeat protein [Pseudoalteromonas rubra]|uniref:Tetratricopeptide repeat protein n=1 Tax=Pseudoalteromonas rubra TaxID=43658 RepID=A0A0F4QVK4_9GAMM|nr:hypothetical protein [Pseudoalteromonas rubra]KJZ11359.1 hypothetical protein TW77_05570 [Pseudoalteromonas rubra]